MSVLELRPAGAEDQDFLLRVYASTRAEEIALTGWDEAQAAAFVRMQFVAQQHHYRTHDEDADFAVVELDGEPVGRLYVARRPERIHVIDIAILPAWRGHGHATALLRQLLAEGARRALPVSIYVEIHNRAQRLYARLGFAEVCSAGLYRLMQWCPIGATPPATPAAPATQP